VTDTMIERAANAIYAAFQAPLPRGVAPASIDTLSASWAAMYRNMARAAIGSMREPTPQMIAAMVIDHDIQGVRYIAGPGAWIAGIDAALKE